MSENIIPSPQQSQSRVPQPQFEFRHRVPLQLRFNDIDMLGHLNNSVYVSFMDLGKAAYFKTVMPTDIDWKHINVVVANINCDFFAPSYFNERLEVLTAVVGVSERSFKMEQRIINSDTGEVKCISHTIMVGFDVATASSAPISQSWIDALSAFEQRPLK